MTVFDYEIRKNEIIIKNLNEKINKDSNKEEKINNFEKIKLEQEFIISLCKLKLINNIKEDNKNKHIKENKENNKKKYYTNQYKKKKRKKK